MSIMLRVSIVPCDASSLLLCASRFLLSLVEGTAYLHGLKHASGDYVIIMDADLSHHVRFNFAAYASVNLSSLLS